MTALDVSTLQTFDRLYPQFIRKFETIIPQAEQSIVDKINSIIEGLNDVGRLTNDVVKNWNTVMTWVMNDGLNQDVSAKIDKMFTDGTFNTVIDGYSTQIVNEFNTQLTNTNANIQTASQNAQTQIDLINQNMVAKQVDLDATNVQLAQKAQQSDIVDIITIKPSGNANTDTTNIQNAFNSARVIKFQNKKDNPFLINAPITLAPIDETTTNVSSNGRIVDFNNCTIQATNNIANAFIIQSSAFPLGMRNLVFKNVVFDGTVTDSFVLVQNSFFSYSKLENISSTYNATADSLIRLINTDTGQAQGGLFQIKRVRSMNNIKNAIRFSKDSGANGLFDDMIIEDISSRYIGNNLVTENFGRCIRVDDNCIITVSLIRRLFVGGYGFLIELGSGSAIMNSEIKQLYSEAAGDHAYGITGGTISNCTIDLIRMYLGAGQSVTTFARCIYSQPVECKISHLYMDLPGATTATGVYYEEIGATAKNNILEKIGDDPLTRIKLFSTNGNTKVNRNYNDPYFYAKGGNLVSASDNVAKTINLINIPKADMDATNIIRIKIKGETSANTGNTFKLQLTGTGVSIDLLNYISTSAANIFEVEADIIFPNTTYMYCVSRGIIGTSVVSNGGTGTPLHAQVTTPDPLKVVLNITGSNYIGIVSITAEKINNVLKPLTGGAYAQ